MAKEKPAQLSTIELPGNGVTLDIEEFNTVIHGQGVTFVHYRAMRCPVGLIDQYDFRRPHPDHTGCSNGFVYTKAGELTCLFLGNSKNVQQTDIGYKNGSTVQVTFPRYYDRNSDQEALKPIDVAEFDRLYLNEESVTVPHWQLFESSQKGVDKMSFPVVSVSDLMDSDGKRYSLGDFEVREGKIYWLTSNRPQWDPSINKGKVCAIRYQYRPYWYLLQFIHQVRVTQAEDPITGERRVNRLPQTAILQRECVFEKEDNDSQAPDPNSARQVPPPDERF